jgi:hypothetical protein
MLYGLTLVSGDAGFNNKGLEYFLLFKLLDELEED